MAYCSHFHATRNKRQWVWGLRGHLWGQKGIHINTRMCVLCDYQLTHSLFRTHMNWWPEEPGNIYETPFTLVPSKGAETCVISNSNGHELISTFFVALLAPSPKWTDMPHLQRANKGKELQSKAPQSSPYCRRISIKCFTSEQRYATFEDFLALFSYKSTFFAEKTISTVDCSDNKKDKQSFPRQLIEAWSFI